GLIIIEGAYCLKNMFREIYDMAFFMDVDKLTQKQRIINRGGDYSIFSAKWIPLEEKYIVNEKPNEFAKIIDTTKIHRI
ncbi:MAG: uridine kinase, partial [Oscillospiraceae bacterium]